MRARACDSLDARQPLAAARLFPQARKASVLRSREVRCIRCAAPSAESTLVRDALRVKRCIAQTGVAITLRK